MSDLSSVHESESGTCSYLDLYTSPIKPMERALVGREDELMKLNAGLCRPEYCNVILLAEAGSGKTALVQGQMMRDSGREYLEVDLSKMIADIANPDEMAPRLKALFDEVAELHKTEGKEIVLFIDEFHQVVQLSAAAVEALKPCLADSGTRGIKVIAATTLKEFDQFIAPNQPLVERLQRINLPEPDKKTTVKILKGFAKRYGVAEQFYDDSMYNLIYEYTNRYVPANAQPRKSILMLDAMVGWHKATGKPLNKQLLAEVIYQSEGINVSFRVDATKIKETLDSAVFAQELATTVVANRLQIAVADLNNKSKPMSSFLFTGSTGVGKSQVVDTKIPVWTEDGSVTCKIAGDIVPGDYIFDREGKPTRVLGVFPQGKRDVYRVTLGDGRTIDVSDNHLWAVYPAKHARDEGYTIYSTQTLINKGLETKHHDRVGMKYFIPMNQPVAWAERKYEVEPYVVGVAIANGLLTSKDSFQISTDDEFVVKKVSDMLGAAYYERECDDKYSWNFYTGELASNGGRRRIQVKDLFGQYPDMYMKKSAERRIPRIYMTGSVEQRWNLVQGLFDSDGSIGQADDDRYNVFYSTSSKGLVDDVQELLYSLGVASSIGYSRRDKDGHIVEEYTVHVKSCNADKYRFFSLPRKLDIAKKSLTVNKQREKIFDYVGIRSIEKLPEQKDMVCFYVDNDEHLYQAGQYIVTHNTELTKTLASVLFGQSREDDENQSSNRNLIRFDMTEYANPDSLERFRAELTARVWERPFSIVLLDEIEKACAEVTRILLQVLDDGRLTDKHGRQVVFTNCYIILTTNAGSEIYKKIGQYNSSDTGDGSGLKRYMKLIRSSIAETSGDNRFPPELLGRIDAIVPFQPLSEETQRKIVINKLRKLIRDVGIKHGIALSIDDKVIDYLVRDKLDTDSDSGGARIIMTKLEEEVTMNVAKFINAHPEVKNVGVCVRGRMAWEDKSMLNSEAYVYVGPLGS